MARFLVVVLTLVLGAAPAASAAIPSGTYDVRVTHVDVALGTFGTFHLPAPTPPKAFAPLLPGLVQLNPGPWTAGDFQPMSLHVTGTTTPTSTIAGYDLIFTLRLHEFFPAYATTNPDTGQPDDTGVLSYALTIAGGTLTRLACPAGAPYCPPPTIDVPPCGQPFDELAVPRTGVASSLGGHSFDPATGTVVFGGPSQPRSFPGLPPQPRVDLTFYMDGCPWRLPTWSGAPEVRDFFASDFLTTHGTPTHVGLTVQFTRTGDQQPVSELPTHPLAAAVVKKKLGTVISHGLPLRVSCFAGCRIAARLRTTAKVKRRRHLSSTVVGRLARRLTPSARARIVRVRLTPRARRALHRVARLPLRAVISLRPSQGVPLHKTLRVTLTR